MYTVLYSYPFSKKDYLLAKFGSAFLAVSMIVGMIGLGFALGTKIPGVKPEALLPFDLLAYCQLYAVFVLPNMFLFGVIVFATVTFTRNIYVGFVAVILLIMIQGIFGIIFSGENLRILGSLLTRWGMSLLRILYVTGHWKIVINWLFQ